MSTLRWMAALPLLVTYATAACLPFTDAGKRIGEVACVAGKVIKVSEGRSGARFLNFCEEPKGCAFTVVIFARDVPDVGDLRWLEGKQIEIRGLIRSYEGQPEIILKDVSQLSGESAKLPPMPKEANTEKRGSYSAGQFKKPRAIKKSRRHRQTIPAPADPSSVGDDPPPPR